MWESFEGGWNSYHSLSLLRVLAGYRLDWLVGGELVHHLLFTFVYIYIDIYVIYSVISSHKFSFIYIYVFIYILFIYFILSPIPLGRGRVE